MKRSIYQFLQDEKEDWQDFAYRIGLKTMAQQLVIGIVAGIGLLLFCGFAEWVHDLIVK